jgi:hypothetical protein
MQRILCRRGVFLGTVLAMLFTIGKAQSSLPPLPGMAAPPVTVQEPDSRFDPTWVNHRGQVVLFLYVGKESDVPQETVDRVGQMQANWSARGFQTVVMMEGGDPPGDLQPGVILVRDKNGATRRDYQITEDREYFLIDRYGRLHRQRIRPSYIERALAEHFDASWTGYSSSWNQSYYVFSGQHLMYLADTVPDVVAPGETLDLRVIALPTFSEQRRGSKIESPVQVEVQADGGFDKSVYKAELNEEVTVSTEMLLQVAIRPDAEAGLHRMQVTVKHRHCGFGNCGAFKQTIPIPVWVR